MVFLWATWLPQLDSYSRCMNRWEWQIGKQKRNRSSNILQSGWVQCWPIHSHIKSTPNTSKNWMIKTSNRQTNYWSTVISSAPHLRRCRAGRDCRYHLIFSPKINIWPLSQHWFLNHLEIPSLRSLIKATTVFCSSRQASSSWWKTKGNKSSSPNWTLETMILKLHFLR